MKAINSPQFSPLAARTLKLVGVILILSFLLDLVILLFPSGLRDRAWQIGLATALVDRGIIPMIGLALLLAGYWIDNNASDSPTNRKAWLDLRFWTLLFSSLLGLLFLVIFPLHINNVRLESARTVQRINQEAEQAENQLQNQLGSEQVQAELESKQNQFRSQISGLLENQQRLNQALESNQLPEDQKKLLQQFKSNPKAVDQFAQQQFTTEGIRTRELTRIRRRKAEVEQQATQDALKSGLRIGISSLLLSIGYIVIGWTGLRSMGVQSGRGKSSAR